MSKDPISQYLSRYAEPLAIESTALERPVRHVVCIPVCNENPRFLETLESLNRVIGSEDSLLILLVNGSEDAPESVHQQNAVFLSWIRDLLGVGNEVLTLSKWRTLSVLLIDHASPGHRLPPKQGVGLARKIAGDVALRLHQDGWIHSPWMACTDADVQLPKDYFTALPPDDAPYAAALYPFFFLGRLRLVVRGQRLRADLCANKAVCRVQRAT